MDDKNTLINAVKRHGQGAVIMVEVPTEGYFGSNADSVRQLVRDGFEGVYVSFQRPYNNVVLLFQQQGIDTKKLVIVDAASACGNERPRHGSWLANQKHGFVTQATGRGVEGADSPLRSGTRDEAFSEPRPFGEKGKKTGLCVPVSSKMDVDEIVRAIYTSLAALKSRKRFVFIDSITTIALYQPLSETLRFSEFLVRTVRQREGGVSTSTIVFNVARDLAQKQFIRDVALRADEVIAVK